MGLSSLFYINQKDFKLKFYPSHISLDLWVDTCRSKMSYPTEEIFFRSYLGPGDVVIDIGANIGFFTLISLAEVGPTGKVYSIEAHPRIFGYLKGNISANNFKNYKIYNLALGEKRGLILFSDESHDDLNTITHGDEGIEIQMVRLDDLDIKEESIALLKIDVEGYEKFVLQGATKFLRRVQCIFFESWENHFTKFSYTLADIFDILTSAGFKVLRIEKGSLISVERNYCSPQCENLIAVRNLEAFQQKMAYNASGKARSQSS